MSISNVRSKQQHSTATGSRINSDGNMDDKCPICLGRKENESRTDGCVHRFCFVCLNEWSKIKTECPMCKAPFKNIMYNLKIKAIGNDVEAEETYDT